MHFACQDLLILIPLDGIKSHPCSQYSNLYDKYLNAPILKILLCNNNSIFCIILISTKKPYLLQNIYSNFILTNLTT